jgi:hypothetical protein
MSASNLFNIAGSIFAVLPVGHTIFYRDIIVPSLKPSGASEGAYASKVSWNQANGYFITTGINSFFLSLVIRSLTLTALLCFKWAKEGVAPGIETYIFGVLMATQCLTALSYLRKGITSPPAVYIILSALMGIAKAKGA